MPDSDHDETPRVNMLAAPRAIEWAQTDEEEREKELSILRRDNQRRAIHKKARTSGSSTALKRNVGMRQSSLSPASKDAEEQTSKE